MSTTNLERSLQSWLADGPTGAPNDVVERALAQAATLPQSRPIVTWPRLRWLDAPARGLAQAAASIALVLLLGGIGFILSQQVGKPVPTPSPSPTPLPTAPLEWQRMGQIDASPNGFLAFNGGYLAYANFQREGDERPYPWSWFTTNGTDWEMARLDTPDNCDDGEVILGPTHAATDGELVVAAGRGATCAVSWVSADGVTWQRSANFATGNRGEGIALWAVGGAFEMVLDGDTEGQPLLWRSTDGLSWQQVGAVSADPMQVLAGGAGPDGKRMISLNAKPYVSDDGATWQRLDSLVAAAGEDEGVLYILPATAADPNWLVAMTEPEPAGSGVKSIWRSSDLVSWTQASLPIEALSAPVRTQFGYLVLARGQRTPGNELVSWIQLVSADGSIWQQLPGDTHVDRAADGPAGVLGLAGLANGSDVWQLLPASAVPSPSPTQSPVGSPSPLTWIEPVEVPRESLGDFGLAVDPAGNAHVAASGGGINHLSNSGGSWTSEAVTTERDHFPILRFDNETPTIAFVRYGGLGGDGVFAGTVPINPQGVFLTTFDGTNWSEPLRIPIEWNGPVEGRGPYSYDMAVRDGHVYLAWADSDGVWHATDYTGEWVSEHVDSTGAAPQIRLASDGKPHLVFHRDDGSYSPIGTTPQGGFPLDSARLVALGGYSPMLAIDGSDRAHLVYTDDATGAASYASFPFADPRSVFEPDGSARAFDVDTGGRAYVLGVADGSWMFASGTGAGFEPRVLAAYSEPVDGEPPAGTLVVDATGTVHVLIETLTDVWRLLYIVGSP